MDQYRVETNNSDADREPTAEELASVPTMTQAEMLKVMRSPEYRTSKLVQKLIAASIAKQNPSKPEGELMPWQSDEGVQTGDELAAKQATVTKMFRDPRYKSDPTYRLEVQQKMAELTAQDGTLSASDVNATNQSVRVQLSTSPFHGADLRVQKYHRIELRPDGPKEPTRKPKPEPFADWK